MEINKIYIAKRFLLKDNQGYNSFFISAYFDEIVTADSELCDSRYSELEHLGFPIDTNINKSLLNYSLEENEQYVCVKKIDDSFSHEEITGFTYCGVDVLDKFKTNSWVTNYGIYYDLSPENYTSYGLLKDVKAFNIWLSKRLFDKDSVEINQKEYFLVAIWRKV